jgi:hypothetical protein
VPSSAPWRFWPSGAEDEREGRLDGAALGAVEASGGRAEAPRIDDGRLLDERAVDP